MNTKQERQRYASHPELLQGKLPPQCVDIEEAILGILFIYPDAMVHANSFITPEMFYRDAHQYIYSSMQKLHTESQPFDILSVTNQLKKDSQLEIAGGTFYISQLSNSATSPYSIEQYCMILTEKFMLREAIRCGIEATKSAYENTADPFEILEKLKREVSEIEEIVVRHKNTNLSDQIDNALVKINTVKSNGSNLPGFETPFPEVDAITLGRNTTDLVIIGARASMGKTTFALNEAFFVAQAEPVVFFSLEVSYIQIVTKIIAMQYQMTVTDIRKRVGDISAAANALKKMNDKFILYDLASLNINDCMAICRKLKRTKKISSVYIDYLQLMTGVKDAQNNKNNEIGSISRGLKQMAKELDVSVIALSQLNRDADKRGNNPRPRLTDLRDSGNIEQDADIVQFIHRPEYYGIDTINIKGQNVSSKNKVEVITAKNRNGALGSAYLEFLMPYSKMKTLNT